jgi:hypothetical protein
MQKWKILLRSGDVNFLEAKLSIMKGWMEAFWKQSEDVDTEGFM